MSFDGTNKSSVGKAQNIEYWNDQSPITTRIKDNVLRAASPEAIAYLDPLNYKGPGIIADASTLSADEWQNIRKDSIGSSAVAQVFGDSPYKGCTNLDLYYEKIGFEPSTPKETDDIQERMFLYGHLMEEYLHLIIQQTFKGAKVIVDTNIYCDPKRPFLTANLDRMVQLQNGRWVHVEFKTTGDFGEDAYNDGVIPLHYRRQLVQCQHIMNVWDSYLIVLLSRDKILIRRHIRDLDEEMEQIAGADEFWNYNVKLKVPPQTLLGPADNLFNCVKKYTPANNYSQMKFLNSPELANMASNFFAATKEIEAANSRIKELETVKSIAAAQIGMAMGEATSARIKALANSGMSYEIIWKPQKPRNSCDFEKLEINEPDIYARYVTKGIPPRPMKIKQIV